MLTTTGIRNFEIELQGSTNSQGLFVNDATAIILGGTARIGNSLVPWDGTRILINQISNFSGTSSDTTHWQNCLLYLYQDSSNVSSVNVDMTRVCSNSLPFPTPVEFPTMPDSTSYPLSLMTFYSLTGSDSTLRSYNRY